MEDIIFVLLAALVAFLLFKYVVGAGGAPKSTYGSTLIGGATNAATQAAHDVSATIASFSKDLGALTIAVDRNFLAGSAKAGEKNPVPVPSPKSFQNENTNTEVNAVKTGESLGGNFGLASIVPASIIDAFSGAVQGASSTAQSDYKKLPAVHGMEHAVGVAVGDTGKFIARGGVDVYRGLRASDKFSNNLVKHVGSFFGHLF